MHGNRWETASAVILLRVEFRRVVGRSPTSAMRRGAREERRMKTGNEIMRGKNRREKEKGEAAAPGWDKAKRGEKRRGAVTNEPVSVLSSCRENNHTSPHGFNEPGCL